MDDVRRRLLQGMESAGLREASRCDPCNAQRLVQNLLAFEPDFIAIGAAMLTESAARVAAAAAAAVTAAKASRSLKSTTGPARTCTWAPASTE